MRKTVMALVLVAVTLGAHLTALADCRRWDSVPDGETCNPVCDGNGNCETKCYPRLKRVCVEEYNPPPQTTQPAGGLVKGGGWGGATIPIK